MNDLEKEKYPHKKFGSTLFDSSILDKLRTPKRHILCKNPSAKNIQSALAQNTTIKFSRGIKECCCATKAKQSVTAQNTAI